MCDGWTIKVVTSGNPHINFLSLKPTKVTSDFILNYLKKNIEGATTQKYQKQIQSTLLLKNYSIIESVILAVGSTTIELLGLRKLYKFYRFVRTKKYQNAALCTASLLDAFIDIVVATKGADHDDSSTTPAIDNLITMNNVRAWFLILFYIFI